MPKKPSCYRSCLANFVNSLLQLRADQRGTIAVLMGILLPILVGMLGVGFEIGNWYLKTRAMQNAADAAAIAAATNGSATSTTPTYQAEAASVAANYTFVNGSNNVTVMSDASNSYCPAGLTFVPPSNDLCYKVTINSVVPLYLSQVVGFSGDTTVNGARAKRLSSTAIAYAPKQTQPICLLALDPTGTALTTNGSPDSDFTGCTVMSNSSAGCNGSNLQAWMGIAVGTNGGGTGCGGNQLSNQQPMPDPFSQYAINIPSNLGCNNTWGSEKKGTQTVWQTAPQITNNQIVVCGTLQLTSNITINAAAPTVLYIENGKLDLNNYNLTTTNVTIVFTGHNSDPQAPTYSHYPDDKNGQGVSTLDMIAPTTGSFPGIAIYQNPNLTSGNLGLTYAGNDPLWKISGFIYMPNANVTLSGAIDQATNGAQCFGMVAGSVTINGTGSIYAQTPDASACTAAGYHMPTTLIPGRGQLVG